METSNLPALPQGLRWDVREFLNNEIQFHTPHSRIELRVMRDHRVLGLRFSIRDTTYPVYVVPVARGSEYLRETAELILERHNRRLANLAAAR